MSSTGVSPVTVVLLSTVRLVSFFRSLLYPNAMFRFEIDHKDANARCGRLTTPHGRVATPVFMPVGTVGTVKGITPDQLAACGSTIILANTYHLMLRPGAQTICDLGGLHK